MKNIITEDKFLKALKRWKNAEWNSLRSFYIKDKIFANHTELDNYIKLQISKENVEGKE